MPFVLDGVPLILMKFIWHKFWECHCNWSCFMPQLQTSCNACPVQSFCWPSHRGRVLTLCLYKTALTKTDFGGLCPYLDSSEVYLIQVLTLMQKLLQARAADFLQCVLSPIFCTTTQSHCSGRVLTCCLLQQHSNRFYDIFDVKLNALQFAHGIGLPFLVSQP